MKKTILTIGGVLGMTIGVLAQGSILVANGGQEDEAGFNSVSSNPFDTGADGTYSDFVSGIVTLEIFDIPYSSTAASEAVTINADAASGYLAAC